MTKKEALNLPYQVAIKELLRGEKNGRYKLRAYSFDGYAPYGNHAVKSRENGIAEAQARYIYNNISRISNDFYSTKEKKFIKRLLGKVWNYPKYSKVIEYLNN